MVNQSDEKEVPQEEVASRPNSLKLLQLDLTNYAGLNYDDKALVIYFPENERIIEMSGDQGVGKTSIMNGLKSLLGEPEPANAINSKADNKHAMLSFKKGDDVYSTKITKKSFTLTLVKEVEGKMVNSSINKPKDVLSSLIGPIGVSPEFLSKKKSGPDQIEWIKSLVSTNTEISKLEEEANEKYASAYKERTSVNGTVNRLQQELLATGYFIKKDDDQELKPTDKLTEHETTIASAPQNADEISSIFKTALDNKNQLESSTDKLAQNELKVKELELQLSAIEQQIKDLQQSLVWKQKEIDNHKEWVEAGKSKIESLVNAPQEYLKAQKNMDNASTIALLQRDISDAKKKSSEYTVARAEQTKLNNKMSELDNVRKEIAKEFTPNVEGLEIEIGGNIDNVRPVGVYYNGTNIAFLSESELWDLCLQIWNYTGTSIVFIENSSSLGTEAMQRVNWFAEKGGTVFMSTVQRGYKKLDVSFHKAKD